MKLLSCMALCTFRLRVPVARQTTQMHRVWQKNTLSLWTSSTPENTLLHNSSVTEIQQWWQIVPIFAQELILSVKYGQFTVTKL